MPDLQELLLDWMTEEGLQRFLSTPNPLFGDKIPDLENPDHREVILLALAKAESGD